MVLITSRDRDKKERVGVVGLGKLGYPLAAILGQVYDVIGVDNVMPKIPNEPHLNDLLDTADLRVTTEFSELLGIDKVFCVVSTPSKEDGTFTDENVRNALEKSMRYMNRDGLFNVVSTVMPGTCRKLADEYEVNVAYNPEFIALGNVVQGMLEPDLVLIGADKIRDEDKLREVYRKVFDWDKARKNISNYEDYKHPPIKTMDTISAELAKITLNTYITQKITFANIIGEIADELGANAEAVLRAVGTDTRIGNKYFKPYGAYGGPCFPRDTVAFSKMAGDIPNFAEQTEIINERIARKYGHHDDRKEYQNT